MKRASDSPMTPEGAAGGTAPPDLREAHVTEAPHPQPAGDGGMRGRILHAAAALFHAQGFDRTSMQDIARAVGLTKGSLYHHFSGKQALLYEILQHTLDRALPELEQIAGAPLPAAERLRQAVRLHILTLARDRDNMTCFIEEGRSLAPEYRDANIAYRDRYEGLFRKIMTDGIRSGEFAPTDVRLAGFAVLGMVNWVVRWYRPDGRHSAEEIAARFSDYAVGALRDPGTPLILGRNGPEARDGSRTCTSSGGGDDYRRA